MPLTFLRATAADAESLLAMMRELYAHEAVPFRNGQQRAALLDVLTNPSLGRVWIIAEGDAAVGYMIVTFGFSLEFGGRAALLDELYIVESSRHRGIGTAAVEYAIDTCRTLGLEALRLEVERKNLTAQDVYRRLGFVEHDRYLMTRWIDQEGRP